MRTGSHYRVDLINGVTLESRSTDLDREADELGRTIFTTLRTAKAGFVKASKAEIERLRSLQHKVRAVRTLEQLGDLAPPA